MLTLKQQEVADRNRRTYTPDGKPIVVNNLGPMSPRDQLIQAGLIKPAKLEDNLDAIKASILRDAE